MFAETIGAKRHSRTSTALVELEGLIWRDVVHNSDLDTDGLFSEKTDKALHFLLCIQSSLPQDIGFEIIPSNQAPMQKPLDCL